MSYAVVQYGLVRAIADDRRRDLLEAWGRRVPRNRAHRSEEAIGLADLMKALRGIFRAPAALAHRGPEPEPMGR